MKESSQFNVFQQFAGYFIPYGLLSIRKLRAGAKVCYSALAQQANARGVTQLNLPMLASSIGESESNAVQYLIELEESGLIETSRGNVNKEDVQISFPRHPWQFRRSESERAQPTSSLDKLFAAESPLTETTEGQSATHKKSSSSSKSRGRKRWFGQSRSRHTQETCLGFITYQKEVLGRRHIYDPEGLAESIFHTGKQDDEIDDWLAERANAA